MGVTAALPEIAVQTAATPDSEKQEPGKYPLLFLFMRQQNKMSKGAQAALSNPALHHKNPTPMGWDFYGGESGI